MHAAITEIIAIARREVAEVLALTNRPVDTSRYLRREPYDWLNGLAAEHLVLAERALEAQPWAALLAELGANITVTGDQDAAEVAAVIREHLAQARVEVSHLPGVDMSDHVAVGRHLDALARHGARLRFITIIEAVLDGDLQTNTDS